MRDQYAGDVSDLLKFAFLRALAGAMDRMPDRQELLVIKRRARDRACRTSLQGSEIEPLGLI